jgi:hypothetical protein
MSWGLKINFTAATGATTTRIGWVISKNISNGWQRIGRGKIKRPRALSREGVKIGTAKAHPPFRGESDYVELK